MPLVSSKQSSIKSTKAKVQVSKNLEKMTKLEKKNNALEEALKSAENASANLQAILSDKIAVIAEEATDEAVATDETVEAGEAEDTPSDESK